MSQPPASSQAPTYRQLCVIAREQIKADPTIDDTEWKMRIKDRLITLKFDSPPNSDLIGRAMSAVQRALEKFWGPRPIPQPPTSRAPPTNRPWKGPLTHEEATAALTQIRQDAALSPPRSIPSASNSNMSLQPVLVDGRPGWTPLVTLMLTNVESRRQPSKARVVQAQIDAWKLQQTKPPSNILTPTGWEPVRSSESSASETQHEPHDGAPSRLVQRGGRSAT